MGRIRTIKPEFPHSETIGNLSRDARLLFIQLWTLVDDAGRSRASSRLLASLLYPFDDDAPSLMSGWLTELKSQTCIHLYQAEGNQYLEICNWLKHQKIDHPSASRLPGYYETLANPREDSRALAPDLGPRILDQVPRTLDQDHLASSSDELPAAVFHLPLVDGTEFGLPEKLYVEYCKSYPAVDVMEQLGAMRAWLLSNSKNRKTRDGITRFINNWLKKAQNRAPRDAGANGNTVNRAQSPQSTSPAALGFNPETAAHDDAAQVAWIRRKQAAGGEVGQVLVDFADRWEQSQKSQIDSGAAV